MKYLIIFGLTVVYFATPTFAAQRCNEKYTYSSNDMGMEVRKLERRCKEKASVRAKDEYEFRFPGGNAFNVHVWVNKERSQFEGCKLGNSKIVVRGNGKWSGKIYVDSKEKETMPSYRMELEYIVPHHACGQKVPEGFELMDREGKCYYQKRGCTELCEPLETGQWIDDSCICTPEEGSTGNRG